MEQDTESRYVIMRSTGFEAETGAYPTLAGESQDPDTARRLLGDLLSEERRAGRTVKQRGSVSPETLEYWVIKDGDGEVLGFLRLKDMVVEAQEG